MCFLPALNSIILLGYLQRSNSSHKMATSNAINSLCWNSSVQQGTGDHIHSCVSITGCALVLGYCLE